MNVRVHMRDFATWDHYNVASVEDDNLDHVEVRDKNGEVLNVFRKSAVSWVEIRA
jgi:predicted phosphatase